jgi:hypothetical protein
MFSQSAEMVFDGAVRPDKTLTRRAALTGAVALVLAGCTSTPQRARPTGATVSSDPLGPLYTETLTLITSYDRTTATTPQLGILTEPLREDHRQHAIALAALMGIAAPSISASPGVGGRPMPPTSVPVPTAGTTFDPDSAAARTALLAAERTAQTNAVTACLAASPARAVVLASIAACRATHVEVLR